VVPLFFAILVLGKAIGGSKFTFVYLLAGLSLIDSIANLVFDSTFICFKIAGPYYFDTNSYTFNFYKENWKFWYEFVHALSNIHNYVLILYDYKLRDTR
jgi:hypothetical protein